MQFLPIVYLSILLYACSEAQLGEQSSKQDGDRSDQAPQASQVPDSGKSSDADGQASTPVSVAGGALLYCKSDELRASSEIIGCVFNHSDGSKIPVDRALVSQVNVDFAQTSETIPVSWIFDQNSTYHFVFEASKDSVGVRVTLLDSNESFSSEIARAIQPPAGDDAGDDNGADG